MAEIKSTLDLVMEKARGMTMTPEEKAALKSERIEKQVKVYVQKYMDNLLELEKIQIEMEKQPEEEKEAFQTFLKTEIIGRIEPDQENGRIRR